MANRETARLEMSKTAQNSSFNWSDAFSIRFRYAIFKCISNNFEFAFSTRVKYFENNSRLFAFLLETNSRTVKQFFQVSEYNRHMFRID